VTREEGAKILDAGCPLCWKTVADAWRGGPYSVIRYICGAVFGWGLCEKIIRIRGCGMAPRDLNNKP
jgi:hypothetical protein